MKNFTLKTIIGIILIMMSFTSHSQDRTCGMEAYMEEMLQDPEYAREYEESQRKFKQRLQEYLSNQDLSQRQNTINIPVAVHFPDANEADRACLEVLAQNQIDILNADYTATNSDISTWNGSVSALFPGTTAGAADISFCLAVSNHPPGLDPELLEGNPAITIGYNFGASSPNGNRDANWAGYLNFVVRNIGGGVLGFSPLGGSVALGDAITLNLFAFGSNAVPGCPGSGIVPAAPFNEGRTTTHELGHFFNLRHTFNGDGTGVCGDGGGDFIADTPEVDNSTYGCPAPSAVPSCVSGQPALTMNYMDYVNDACMYMFSAGQISVAEAWITSNLVPAFAQNVCDPPTPGFNLVADQQEKTVCSDDVIFSFSYSTILDFSETTTFSVSGVPSGAGFSLTPNSLTSDGTVTLTLTGLSSAALNTYPITVTGTSASVTEQTTVNLTITDDICQSEGDLSFQTRTTGVIFNTINNLDAGPKTAPYSDFTSISTDVEAGMSYDLSVRANSDGNYQIITRVWIDWNQNCSFDDPGEEYDLDLGTTANIADQLTDGSPLSVTVPADAADGVTTMRVSTKYTSPGGNDFPTSCETGFDGEVEDYSVNVINNLSTDDYFLDNLNIYPNPNNGQFNIGFDSNSGEDITIEVFDLRGRAIFSQRYNAVSRFEEVINLNNAQSGVYLLNISDGPQKLTKKIIVE